MNYIRNWRNIVLSALFIIGLLATLFCFGDKQPEAKEAEYWSELSIAFIIAVSAWYALAKCVTYWEKRGDIPKWSDYNEDKDEEVWN